MYKEYCYDKPNIRQFIYIDTPLAPRCPDGTTPVYVQNNIKPSVDRLAAGGHPVPTSRVHLRTGQAGDVGSFERRETNRKYKRLFKEHKIAPSVELLPRLRSK